MCRLYMSPRLSDVAVFVLKRDAKLQLTICLPMSRVYHDTWQFYCWLAETDWEVTLVSMSLMGLLFYPCGHWLHVQMNMVQRWMLWYGDSCSVWGWSTPSPPFPPCPFTSTSFAPFYFFPFFPFLIRFAYFLLSIPSLFLPESSHSVSRLDVVRGDRTWL